MRPCEIVALNCEDLTVKPDGTGRLLIRTSETNAGDTAVAFLGTPTVRRILSWTETTGITSGLVFRQMGAKRASDKGISEHGICLLVGRRTRAAGIFKIVSGHSLRIGAAESFAAAGASLPEILAAGRWPSPALNCTEPAHGAVARLRYGHQQSHLPSPRHKNPLSLMNLQARNGS